MSVQLLPSSVRLPEPSPAFSLLDFKKMQRGLPRVAPVLLELMYKSDMLVQNHLEGVSLLTVLKDPKIGERSRGLPHVTRPQAGERALLVWGLLWCGDCSVSQGSILLGHIYLSGGSFVHSASTKQPRVKC